MLSKMSICSIVLFTKRCDYQIAAFLFNYKLEFIVNSTVLLLIQQFCFILM